MKTITLKRREVKVYDRCEWIDGTPTVTPILNYKGIEYPIISEYCEADTYTVYQTRRGCFIEDSGTWFLNGFTK